MGRTINRLFLAVAMVGGIAVVAAAQSPAVATGPTPLACTEQALDQAVATGGSYALQCNGQPLAFTRDVNVATQVSIASADGSLQMLQADYSPQLLITASGNLELDSVGVKDATNGAIVNYGALTIHGGSFVDDSNYGDVSGTGSGGAIANFGTATVDSSTFQNDTAHGHNGGPGEDGARQLGTSGAPGADGASGSGAGAEGSPGGNGGAGLIGPDAAAGQPGTPGGAGEGGAIYSAGTLILTNSTFDNDTAAGGTGGVGGTGGSSFGGSGGIGGKGGDGGDEGLGGWGGNGGPGGPGGAAGVGGEGGVGGAGYGGALYLSGHSTVQNDSFYADSAYGGFGGSGGLGGTSVGGSGAVGGNGGKGGDNTTDGGDGGDGGAGGAGGNGGNGGPAGDGGRSGTGGPASGGAIFAPATVFNKGGLSYSGDQVTGGTSFAGGNAGASTAGTGAPGGTGGAGGAGASDGFPGLTGSNGLTGADGSTGSAGQPGTTGGVGTATDTDVHARFVGPAGAFVFTSNGQDFQQVPVGQQATSEVTVESTGYRPLIVGSVTLGGSADYSLSDDTCTGATLGRGQECTVTVTVAPSAAGPISTTLTVPDNTKSGSDRLVFTEGALPLQLEPVATRFGAVAVGSSVTRTLHVSNPNPADFGDDLIFNSIDVADFSIPSTTCFGHATEAGSNALLRGGHTCSIAVTFTPSTTGRVHGAIHIEGTEEGDPTTMALVGTGA